MIKEGRRRSINLTRDDALLWVSGKGEARACTHQSVVAVKEKAPMDRECWRLARGNAELSKDDQQCLNCLGEEKGGGV